MQPPAKPSPDIRDAATVILVRDAPQREQDPSSWQVLMVKRSSKSAFMPDLHVYPGGALDPHDSSFPQDADLATRGICRGFTREDAFARLAEPHITQDQALGLYFAAIREVFEEAGLLLARRQDGELLTLDGARCEAFSAYREALQKGELSLSALLEQEQLFIEPGSLGYFARWITPGSERRRFDARFFVVRAPQAQRALVDLGEVVSHRWDTPRAILDSYARGEIALAPPTFSTLLRLTRFDSIAALERHASTCRPAPILPDMHISEEDEHLFLLPHHPDYSPSLRQEELLPRWREDLCRDTTPWDAFTRSEQGTWRTLP